MAGIEHYTVEGNICHVHTVADPGHPKELWQGRTQDSSRTGGGETFGGRTKIRFICLFY